MGWSQWSPIISRTSLASFPTWSHCVHFLDDPADSGCCFTLLLKKSLVWHFSNPGCGPSSTSFRGADDFMSCFLFHFPLPKVVRMWKWGPGQNLVSSGSNVHHGAVIYISCPVAMGFEHITRTVLVLALTPSDSLLSDFFMVSSWAWSLVPVYISMLFFFSRV